MATAVYEFERLSTKEGFNTSLKHFQAVSALLGEFENRYNLADILNALLSANDISSHQLHSIVYALLVDKYGYSFKSFNLQKSLTDFKAINDQALKLKAADIVISYFHPELGLTLINPKNKDNLASLNILKRDELVVVYAGGFADSMEQKLKNQAIEYIITLLQGKSA